MIIMVCNSLLTFFKSRPLRFMCEATQEASLLGKIGLSFAKVARLVICLLFNKKEGLNLLDVLVLEIRSKFSAE
jgi:hypothetical protein